MKLNEIPSRASLNWGMVIACDPSIPHEYSIPEFLLGLEGVCESHPLEPVIAVGRNAARVFAHLA